MDAHPEKNDEPADSALARKSRALRERLASLESAVIGFSGGADSAYLAAEARAVLGRGRVLAALAVSPSLAAREREAALRLAGIIDVEIETFAGTEFSNPAYVANGPDRCFHCKADLFVHLRRLAEARGFRHLLYGANADDGRDYRPGHRAASAAGALAPLAEAGLAKEEIRALSRAQGLPTADKPASPCLSSRIPYGQRVTAGKLAMVEKGEALLQAMGFRECRLRHAGSVARVEVPRDRMMLLEGEAGKQLERALQGLGFARMEIDPKGFRSGSLNEVLPEDVRLGRPPHHAER